MSCAISGGAGGRSLLHFYLGGITFKTVTPREIKETHKDTPKVGGGRGVEKHLESLL